MTFLYFFGPQLHCTTVQDYKRFSLTYLILSKLDRDCLRSLFLSSYLLPFPRHRLEEANIVKMPELDPLVLRYSHLRDQPREKDALHMLRKVASLVKPLMRQRGWKVGELGEFLPREQNLLGMY